MKRQVLISAVTFCAFALVPVAAFFEGLLM